MSGYDLFFAITMLILVSMLVILLAVFADTKIATRRYKKLAEELKREGFKDE